MYECGVLQDSTRFRGRLPLCVNGGGGVTVEMKHVVLNGPKCEPSLGDGRG
jgi:hypothetical protein